jgi:type III restriction enzyme
MERQDERGLQHSPALSGGSGTDKRIVIVETKGREDLDVPLKMARLRQWCEDINRVQTDVKYDFVYVDEESFEKYKPTSFRQLMDGFKEYKGEM